MLVTFDDLASRLPRPLEGGEEQRARVLLGDAEDLIRGEFAREGRDLDVEVEQSWFATTVRRVIRQMVAAAILVGANAGIRSVSSTTGPTSDQIVFADVGAVAWSEVCLTAAQRAELGLATRGVPSVSAPPVAGWPEVSADVRDGRHRRW